MPARIQTTGDGRWLALSAGDDLVLLNPAEARALARTIATWLGE